MTRRLTGEAAVFAAATALALVHALDDAFVHRGPGLGLGQHALAGLIAIVAGVAGVVAFPRLRPGLRAALAFIYGGLALVNGMLHLIHVTRHGAGGSDVTGVLAVAGGAVLVGLAVAIPWRRRGQGTWRARALAVALGLVATVAVLAPIGMGIVATHKWREPVGDPPSAAYRDVSFKASDGLDIAGWYRPSRNGAAVFVVRGGSSDRKGSLHHAEMLARHGYGVLVYDARGRGESGGSENNYGWDWAKDIAGALAFLERRSDVDPSRIGAVGLSTGADVMIEVAAERDDVAALVTDGAAAGSFADIHRLNGTGVETPSAWLMFQTIRVLSGDRPGPALEDAVGRIDSPLLMISAGAAIERDFNVRYDEVADGPVEHWNLPDAHHTDAIHEFAGEYERRVVGFLNEALL
jgi:dienelactone hydrolase